MLNIMFYMVLVMVIILLLKVAQLLFCKALDVLRPVIKFVSFIIVSFSLWSLYQCPSCVVPYIIVLYRRFVLPTLQPMFDDLDALSQEAQTIELNNVFTFPDYENPSRSLYFVVIIIIALFYCLYRCCRSQISGGRPGQLQSSMTHQHLNNPTSNANSTLPTEPLLLCSPSTLFSQLSHLYASAPAQQSNDSVLATLNKLQESVDRLLIVLTNSSTISTLNTPAQSTSSSTPTSLFSNIRGAVTNILSTDIKEESPAQLSNSAPSSPSNDKVIDPALLSRLATMTPDAAARELNAELKRQRDERKRPVYLSDEEKEMTAEQLYLKFKQTDLAARDADFLQRLSRLPADAREWSRADIKSWFRDQRHEQWALRQLEQGKVLFICPQCNRARDADAHRCIPLWRQSTTRSGVPMQQQTYMTTSGSSFRVGQRTIPDAERISDLSNKIAKARADTIEANNRLAQLHSQANSQPTPTTPESEFPYATHPHVQPYASSSSAPPIIDLTQDDTPMLNAIQAMPQPQQYTPTFPPSTTQPIRP